MLELLDWLRGIPSDHFGHGRGSRDEASKGIKSMKCRLEGIFGGGKSPTESGQPLDLALKI
ncbi:MAG: hypothetical protein ACO3ST_10465, partial [Burkholderiaceae bacterium]